MKPFFEARPSNYRILNKDTVELRTGQPHLPIKPAAAPAAPAPQPEAQHPEEPAAEVVAEGADDIEVAGLPAFVLLQLLLVTTSCLLLDKTVV